MCVHGAPPVWKVSIGGCPRGPWSLESVNLAHFLGVVKKHVFVCPWGPQTLENGPREGSRGHTKMLFLIKNHSSFWLRIIAFRPEWTPSRTPQDTSLALLCLLACFALPWLASLCCYLLLLACSLFPALEGNFALKKCVLWPNRKCVFWP